MEGDFSNVFRYKKKKKERGARYFFNIHIRNLRFYHYWSKFIHSLILDAFSLIRLRDLIIRERDQQSPVFLLLIENSYYLTSIKIGNIRFDVIDAMKIIEINQACYRFSC